MTLTDEQKRLFIFTFTQIQIDLDKSNESNFLLIKKFMEEQYPDLLNLYIASKLKETYHEINDENQNIILVAFLRSILNIDNLISFLIEIKTIWQWVECYPNFDNCGYGSPICKNGKFFNNRCYIKHPAILYLEELNVFN